MTPVKDLKIGDRVRISFCPYDWTVLGKVGVVTKVDRGSLDLAYMTFDQATNTGVKGFWFGEQAQAEKIESDNVALGVKSIADDLRLKPQARKVLAHLKKGLTISPLEARTIYQIERLAASVYDLRKAGYRVNGKRKQDLVGHRYIRYALAA